MGPPDTPWTHTPFQVSPSLCFGAQPASSPPTFPSIASPVGEGEWDPAWPDHASCFHSHLTGRAAASMLLLLSPSGPRVVRPLLSSHLSDWFSSISDLTLILNAGQSRLVLGPPLYACSYLCFHGLNTSPDLLQMSRSVPPTSYSTPALKVFQVPQIYQIEN